MLRVYLVGWFLTCLWSVHHRHEVRKKTAKSSGAHSDGTGRHARRNFCKTPHGIHNLCRSHVPPSPLFLSTSICTTPVSPNPTPPIRCSTSAPLSLLPLPHPALRYTVRTKSFPLILNSRSSCVFELQSRAHSFWLQISQDPPMR